MWSLSCAGFAICYVALLLLAAAPSQPLLWLMVLSQGLLGYAFTSLMGPIVAEIFEGPRFGSIFSLLMVSLIGGGAVGPLVTGLLYDWTGQLHDRLRAGDRAQRRLRGRGVARGAAQGARGRGEPALA